MSTDIPIPVAVAPRLREGAKSLIRTLGCDLQDAADHPPAFGELQERLRGVWAGATRTTTARSTLTWTSTQPRCSPPSTRFSQCSRNGSPK